MTDERRLPLPLFFIGGFYLLSLLLAMAGYGHPFPFMGTFYEGRAARWFAFGDSMACLYLVIGVWKRQRLAARLALCYNAADVANALVNLVLIPADVYARFAGVPVSYETLRSQTLFACALLVAVSIYVHRNRHHFDNRSPYLF